MDEGAGILTSGFHSRQLCKGDMSQHSKTAFAQLSLAFILCELSKSIYNEILFRIYSNIFQVFRMASLVRASLEFNTR